jgi:hypothetical protein
VNGRLLLGTAIAVSSLAGIAAGLPDAGARAAPAPAPNCAAAADAGDPAAGAISIADAASVPDGKPVRVFAYLLMHAQPCPPCPPRHQCEACQPPYPFFGDAPRGGAGGRTTWVQPAVWGTCDLAAFPENQRFVLVGEWVRDYQPGASRVLRASDIIAVPPPG